MRIGDNPAKNRPLRYKEAYHKVCIPVYIPNTENYFSHSLDIFKICLSSLFKTIHEKTSICIISNNCHDTVLDFLNQCLVDGKIDTLILNKQNKGKVDALSEVLRGSFEQYITIADCDTFFYQGWQQETEKLFSFVPHLGSVSQLPLPAACFVNSEWVWFQSIFKGKIIKKDNLDTDNLFLFKKSIGVSLEFGDIEKKPFYFKYKNTLSCIGSGHFCFSIHKNVIPHIPHKKSGSSIVGAENDIFEMAISKAGFLRLSTAKGYVQHMGNHLENWMEIELQNMPEYKKELFDTRTINPFKFILGLKTILYKFLHSKRLRGFRLKLLNINYE